MTDITEHPTREGKLYCCVLDAWSRKVVGWSIDRPTAAMVNSAPAVAVTSRKPPPGAVIHSDHGTQAGQYTSWAFSHTVPSPGLRCRFGAC